MSEKVFAVGLDRRPTSLSTIAITVSLLLLSTAGNAASGGGLDREVRFDIPAQRLDSALLEFSRQAHLPVSVNAASLDDLRAPAVSGRLSTGTALSSLLADSGLSYSASGNTISITTAAASAKPSADGGVATDSRTPPSSKLALAEESSVADSALSRGKQAVLSEVVVTGSRLHQEVGDAPITVYNRETLERFGITTAGELLRVLPENQGTSSTSPFSTLGASHFANLRGLGEGTTLILINGQRVASSAVAFGSSSVPAQFNLDVIPSAAIERVEVLRDGASAVYGSDAIGGVINVVLRRDFSGAELSTKFSSSSANMDENYYSGIVGGQLGRASLMLGGEYYDQDGLRGSARPYSATLDKTPFGGTDGSASYLTGPVPADISAVPGTGNLPGLSSPTAAAPGGAPRTLRTSDFAPSAGQGNPAVDSVALSSLAYPQHRTSAFGRLDLPITDGVSANADVFFSQSRTRFEYASPLQDMTFGAGNPHNPFGVDALVSFYMDNLPAGGFGQTDTQDVGATLGVEARLGGDWELHANALYGQSRLHEAEGYADPDKIAAALVATDAASALDPLFNGAGNSSALVASLITSTLDQRARVDNRGLSLAVTGSAFSLPAGPVRIAGGVEGRREALDTLTLNLGATPATVDQSRDVRAAYAEIGVPLLKGARPADEPALLDASIAARYEHYSDFGDTTNPKIGLRFRPFSGFTVRSTWGTAFQAPSMSQLYSSKTVFRGVVFRPIFDPVLNQSYRVSNTIANQGNPDLEPQKADTATLGFQYIAEFAGGTLNASSDLYRVRFRDRIRTVSNQELISLEGLFPNLIVRDPVSDRITDIVNAPINLARVNTNGVDLSLSYTTSVLGGTLATGIGGTIVNKYDVQLSPLLPVQDRRSYIGYSNHVKGSLQIQYSRSIWSASAIAYSAGSYRSDVQPQNDIRSQTTLDLQVGVRCCSWLPGWFDGIKLVAGVINVFNREPPFYDNSAGFDYGEGDPLQRRVYAKVTATF